MSRNIAIVGAGAVGTAWAVQLIRAGHQVTLVARGSRLAQLQKDGSTIRVQGKDDSTTPIAISVDVTTSLDTNKPWYLVIVSVLGHQVDSTLLTTLKDCQPSTQILFFFNTFAPLKNYAEKVGPERTLNGFPSVWSSIEKDGTLLHSFPGASEISDRTWQAIFVDAGIPCKFQPDMESWLRTHAAMHVGFLSVVVPTGMQNRGATVAEAYTGARVAHEGAQFVEGLGNTLIPWHHALFFKVPMFVLGALFWIASRVPTVRKRAQASNRWRDEMINLSDAMIQEARSSHKLPWISDNRMKYQ